MNEALMFEIVLGGAWLYVLMLVLDIIEDFRS